MENIAMTEVQAANLRWLYGKVTEAANGQFILTTDYRENSPQYTGNDLGELLEKALEDYADWDESN